MSRECGTAAFGSSAVVFSQLSNQSLNVTKNLHVSSYTHLPEEKI